MGSSGSGCGVSNDSDKGVGGRSTEDWILMVELHARAPTTDPTPNPSVTWSDMDSKLSLVASSSSNAQAYCCSPTLPSQPATSKSSSYNTRSGSAYGTCFGSAGVQDSLKVGPVSELIALCGPCGVGNRGGGGGRTCQSCFANGTGLLCHLC